MSELFAAVVRALGEPACAPWRTAYALAGYVVVGSSALPGCTDPKDGSDTDVVLLSTGSAAAGQALSALGEALRGTLTPAKAQGRRDPVVVAPDGVTVWFVNATVPLLKLEHGEASLDLLWLPGCEVPPAVRELPPLESFLEPDFTAMDDDEEDAAASAPPPRAFEAEDPGLVLPPDSPAADCILLTRLFRRSLRMARTTFTAAAVRAVRSFARRRHVYGTKYGYPGGSAWCTMLWAYCMYLDADDAAREHTLRSVQWNTPHPLPPPPPSDCSLDAAPDWPLSVVLRRFLTTLAVWPWPLPWTAGNMHALVSDGALSLDGTSVEVCIGRHVATAFVVPLPVVCGARVWNMTQCVQAAPQRALLREAWCAAVALAASGPTHAPPLFDDLRAELRALRAAGAPNGLGRWPVYLTLRQRDGAPPAWRGIVAARLMATLLPQLEACGFFARPVCVDRPAYKVLLWPMDAVWTTHAPADVVLPLRDRLMPCLYVMLRGAYAALWSSADDARPPLTQLLPVLNLELCDADD